MFIDYVLSAHRGDLLKILGDRGLYNSYTINIDFLNLFENDPNSGDNILCNPKNEIPKCDKELVEAQKRFLDDLKDSSVDLTVKNNVYTRFYGLPVCPELHRITIPKNKDLGCFLKLTGTAVRVTQARMLEYKRNYKCVKCHYIQSVDGLYEQKYTIKPPAKCTNPEETCRSQTMTPVNVVTRENCKDYQELKIQEQVNKLTVGGIPGSIWVTLEDDLVDKCQPGDDVSICGTVLRRWNPMSANKKCDVELVFKANHIEVCNAQKAVAVSVAPDAIKEFDEFWVYHKTCPMKGRDVILATVCPKVYGLYMVKLALTLTIITGSSYDLARNDLTPQKNKHNSSLCNDDKDRSTRGQCHLLLVGDPGTGKSQLLKAGSNMLSRSVITSGSGSTKAGLTCTAMREEGEWQLEAGALVLADGGACFIDELAQMREHDRASIHEAMEQQTISVAKAGIICKLNTRCAVIAACNPKGNYDTDQPLSINVSLGTPLLSRFDLIFILLDTQNCEWDNLVSDYVLFGKTTKSLPKGWPLEKLQLYMSLIGPFEVRMSQEANTILRAYYVRQRKAPNRDPSRTTVRMLDSLVRLTQAHAKLMYRHETLAVDAVIAVSLVDLSMQDCTLSDTSDALHTSFSFYPDLEYLKMAKKILSTLNLYEIWHSEVSRYSKMLNIGRQELESNVEKNITKHFVKNIMVDDSIAYTDELVVESSFFHNSENNTSVVIAEGEISKGIKETSKESTSKNIFEDPDKSDDDLDSILTVDFNVPNEVAKTNLTNKADKEKTTVLLAQTLRKHSNMYKRNLKSNIGIIEGRKKRQRSKSNKNSNAKKVKIDRKANDPNSELQLVLNELNKNDKKQKSKAKASKKMPCKNGKIVIEAKADESELSSDGGIDETKIMNCLPSVNDIFSIMDCESEEETFDIPEQSIQNSNEHSSLKAVIHDKVLDSNTDINCEELNKSKDNGKSLSNYVNKETNKSSKNGEDKSSKEESRISPVSAKTLDKLKQFSFTKSKVNDDVNTVNNTVSGTVNNELTGGIDDRNDNENVIISRSGGSIEKGDSDIKFGRSDEINDISNFSSQEGKPHGGNKDNISVLKTRSDVKILAPGEELNGKIITKCTSLTRSDSKFLSQGSIFENEDEDYGNLDL